METTEAEVVHKSSFMERYRDPIFHALRTHDVVIVVAPTGSGKSTDIPIMLLDFADRVVVTQPRRIATESLAYHVAMKMGTELGDVVGFQTAFRENRSPDTRLIYCTDGIEVMRQLHREADSDTIYVVDEVHEWSLNLELLVAWFKKQLSEGKPFKLVLLSATLEADRLAEFFGNAEVINCEGTTFRVEEETHKGGVVSAAVRFLRRGMNVLVFVPGKHEIRETIKGIMNSDVRAKCLPFHAELSSDDVQWIFEAFDEPKCVVATTIAQTSLTIPDIDAVVDSGLERNAEYVNGVEGLYTRPISLAEKEQRRGRAGRTKPGLYIDCLKTPLSERPFFSKPAIERYDLSGLALQILVAGYEPEELAFFHPPAMPRIQEARKTLVELGFLDTQERPTVLGLRAASLPISPRAARMVLTAVDAGGVVDYSAITFATLFDGVHMGFRAPDRKELVIPAYVEVGESDAFALVKDFDAAMLLPRHMLHEYGIDSATFERLLDQRALLVKRLARLGYTEGKATNKLQVRFIVAGLADCVFTRSLVAEDYSSPRFGSVPRNLPRGTTITAKRIVGFPWNYESHTNLGPTVRRLLLWATAIPE